VGGIKAFLVKAGPFGLPMYAYVGGAVALIGGIWYFKTHAGNTGNATVAPQTNASTDALTPPMPYPSGGGVPVPPSPPFTTGGSTATGSTGPLTGGSVGTGSLNPAVASDANALPTSTANFIPTAPVATTSQVFASTVQPTPINGPSIVAANIAKGVDPGNIPGFATPIQPANYLAPISVATPVQAAAIAKALANVPVLGNIVNRIVYPPKAPAPAPFVAAPRAPTAANSGRSGAKFA
jgi:hypothetical protein